MARLFDDASTEYLLNANAVLTGVPITMACWGYSDQVTIETYAMTLAYDGDEVNYFALGMQGNKTNDPIVAQTVSAAGAKAAKTGAGFTVDTWHHMCAVFATTTSRIAYVDGSPGTAETTERTPVNINKTAIGVRYRLTPINHWSGHLAECAIWNIGLSAAEIQILAAGYSPLFVHPQNLVAYWPLVRGLNDSVGGYNMTATGTVVSAHPRIINPSELWQYYAAAAVGGIVPQAYMIMRG